jgi:hypothetical protein
MSEQAARGALAPRRAVVEAILPTRGKVLEGLPRTFLTRSR